ncbi:MAG: ThiF family adenylyltransferase, partial [Candidatus Eremiobacteraeota bacterium]|nr:ThiF family adenylyltransferase [Candidatus Eremiobacteraeota bacterium]
AGQGRLSDSRVLCIGAGGLGSPVLSYLCAAGVGRIGVMDDDVVDETNLQRQTLFTMDDVGRPKVEVAVERLQSANPYVSFDAILQQIDGSNAREIVRCYDVVVDCTDSFTARYLINDACFFENKPDVYGSIFRFDGQVSIFGRGGPCYRCLFPQPPPPGAIPSCAEGGVLGALAGIVGALQASEVLKLVLDIGAPLRGRLLIVDALSARVREIAIDRDPDCRLCGQSPTLHDVSIVAIEDATRIVQIDPSELDTLGNATVLDVREPHEAVLGAMPGSVQIPASQLEARLHELDSSQTYIVACRLGARSQWAFERLRDAGFKKLFHLRGGLLAYTAVDEDFNFF